METRSRVASLSYPVAVAALLLFGIPPFATQLGFLSSRTAFLAFMLGGLLGLVALVLGLAGLYATRSSSGRGGRGLALRAAVIGAGIVAAVLLLAGPNAGVPAINDITTDTEDPPRFVAALEAEGNRERDMGYPGSSFAVQQLAAYPDVVPIRLDAPPERVFADAERAMRELGWTVVRRDPESGALEATETSEIFRFVDDVVVRIRPADGGSVVDVRSKSREGRSDLGANAARIRRLRDALAG